MSYVAWIRSRLGPRKVILAYSTVILRDAHGRVLLQRRTDLPVWGFPGGVLEPGETLEACGRRELLEETGLEAGPLSLVGLYTSPRYDVGYPNGDQAQQFTVCLTGTTAGGRMQVDGDEAAEQRFFPPDELPLAEMPGWYRRMWNDCRAGGAPAADPPETSGPVPQPTMSELMPGEPGLLTPLVVAAVRRPDGQVLAQARQDGVAWPMAEMRLGESAAATAAGLARRMTGVALDPVRLLGVFSGRRSPLAGTAGVAQVVAAAFLLEAPPGLEPAAGAIWLESGLIPGFDLVPDGPVILS